MARKQSILAPDWWDFTTLEFIESWHGGMNDNPFVFVSQKNADYSCILFQ